MSTLVLKFTDENAVERQVEVDRERFTIGRHSSCDLTIADARLSREHLAIERQGDGFVVSDLGSSNGSELNGDTLDTSVPLRDGDRLDLGGGVLINVEYARDSAVPITPPQDSVLPRPTPVAAEQKSPASAGIPVIYFVAAPVVALLVIAVIGTLIFIFSTQSPGSARASQDGDDPFIEDDRPTKTRTNDDPASSDDKPANAGTVKAANENKPSQTAGASPPQNLGATGKVEEYAAKFLRKIAQNDPSAFLTSEQAKILDGKIKQVAVSSSLPGNINSAKKSSSQLSSLARSKNLAPEFLAVAAINKLGAAKGDVLQTAQGMVDVLDKLGTQIGSELSDDSLLMIAAYEQGVAGEFLKMRNMLQGLSNEFPDSSRAIRTIWFLNSKKKISPSDFDRALTFLAIGTISQAPKEFGVNAEPLSF